MSDLLQVTNGIGDEHETARSVTTVRRLDDTLITLSVDMTGRVALYSGIPGNVTATVLYLNEPLNDDPPESVRHIEGVGYVNEIGEVL